MSQLSDRLEAAVLTLVADGSVKQRLAGAYSRHLGQLEEQELPEEARAEFRRLKDALHRYPPVSGQSAVEATVRKMSARQCEQQAGRIVSLLTAVLTVSRGDRLKVVPDASGERSRAAGRRAGRR